MTVYVRDGKYNVSLRQTIVFVKCDTVHLLVIWANNCESKHEIRKTKHAYKDVGFMARNIFAKKGCFSCIVLHLVTVIFELVNGLV